MSDNPAQPVSDELCAKITRNLRDSIEVRVPKAHVVLSDPDFWGRSHLLTPNPIEDLRSRVFVDGFAKCCHWNSWKVYTDAIEPGLTFWAGFAFCGASWTHHEWCMLGNRIIETTVPYNSYYGAEIQKREFEIINQRFANVDLTQYVDPEVGVWTFLDERRQCVPYDPAVYAKTIGRERDPKTSELKEGLGR